MKHFRRDATEEQKEMSMHDSFRFPFDILFDLQPSSPPSPISPCSLPTLLSRFPHLLPLAFVETFRIPIHHPEDVRIPSDHVGLDLVQEPMHEGFPLCLLPRERIRFETVEVRLSCARDDSIGESSAVGDSKDILVGTEADLTDFLPTKKLCHVWTLLLLHEGILPHLCRGR